MQEKISDYILNRILIKLIDKISNNIIYIYILNKILKYISDIKSKYISDKLL